LGHLCLKDQQIALQILREELEAEMKSTVPSKEQILAQLKHLSLKDQAIVCQVAIEHLQAKVKKPTTSEASGEELPGMVMSEDSPIYRSKIPFLPYYRAMRPEAPMMLVDHPPVYRSSSPSSPQTGSSSPVPSLES